MITAHGTVKGYFQTDSNYWDCECPNNYIHLVLKGKFCPKCNCHYDNMPESRVSEIAKLYVANRDNAINPLILDYLLNI